MGGGDDPSNAPIFEVTELQNPRRRAVKTSPLTSPTIIVNVFEEARAEGRRVAGMFAAEIVKLRPLLNLTRIGARFERIKPGTRTSYPHAHRLEGELVYCISGNGLIWQNGFTYPFRSGDCASWTAGTGVVHTVINDSNRDEAPGEDLLLISVSENREGESWWYPLSPERRAQITPAQTWDEKNVPPQADFGPHPGLPSGPHGLRPGEPLSNYPYASAGGRPGNIVNATELSAGQGDGDLFSHSCNLTAETHCDGIMIGCHLQRLPPGTRSSVGHAHKDSEEMVLVLQGTGSLWLDGHIVPVKPGDCVGFPAGTGIAHTFINDSNAGGDDGHDLCLVVVGEKKRKTEQIIYPADPEKEAAFKRWWTDYPRHALGPHKGVPNFPRK
ncbi:hypothetical protein AURDEDRAFT_184577 [Auricularia subglabra TFB-10046 SS5]|nr:hypothetical protein AURDEDRAFT_184577 [Auricularia subglabra TFB-10046 SS5]